MKRRPRLGLLLVPMLAACATSGRGPAVRPMPPPSATVPPAAEAPVSKPSPVEPVPTPTPPAAPAPLQEDAKPAVPAAPPTAAVAAPRRLRIGLETDEAAVTLLCCESEAWLEIDGQRVPVLGPVRVEPASGVAERPKYRLQVAALREESEANALARRLADRTGEVADAHFDAGVGLHRVRVGRWSSREEAEIARRALAAAGLPEGWIISEGGSLEAPALRVIAGGRTTRVDGRWLALVAEDGGTLRFAGKRYRDRLLVYLNDRGRLNVINELALEDYLRGVVPREMGPDQFPRLESLKAQAVAARTYALINLGGFTSEGYDLCSTPACQVYGGRDAEHPLSDRAVAETAGEVLLYQGELVETLYTATCGGHTEDVEIVFPEKRRPYLRGVACLEAGVHSLVTAPDSRGADFPAGLLRRLLPAAATSDEAAHLSMRLEALANLAGLAVPQDRLRSLSRSEVQRFLLSLFDLALDASLFVPAEDLPYLTQGAPAGWSQDDRRRAAYLAKMEILTGPLAQAPTQEELDAMLLALAERLQVVREEEAFFVRLAGRQLVVRDAAGVERTVPAAPGLTAFRLQGTAATSADLALVAGDPLRLYLQGDELIAVVQSVDADGVAFDRESKWSKWTRFHTDSEIAAQVRQRFPSLAFNGLEILERGKSGRVGKIRVRGKSGETATVEGLAVRWVLDVPETLFTAKRLQPKKGPSGWLFTGKGWGHGVGMCQTGAYGMAGRGATYREILSHYYTGTVLGRVE